jgi:putative ABC transport system permease protein
VRPAPLERKLLRDLWRLKWQVLAIALLIACGVSVAVMAFSAQRALAQAQAAFYADTRFADAFAQARRAPLSRAQALTRIDGVTAVDARIVESGLMDVPGLSRPAVARVISLPEDPERALNQIRLVRGRMPDPASRDEVVALNTFLDAANVRLGDRLTTVLEGRSFTFTIVGAALSPEYVYVPAPESFMPDDAHQGVFWAPRATVERAAGMTGAFNAVALKLAPGASLPAVLQDVDRILAPYGGLAAQGREDQASHAFLDAELKELSTSASILPPVFLIVAAALVHLVVSRLVDSEREQIGLLKAFGYRDSEAAQPYLKTAAAIGLTGALAGGLLGASFGAAIVGQYRQYFRFPNLEVDFHWGAFLIASAVAVGATLAGSISAVRRAAALSPAVAMQPLRPAVYRRGLLDRLAPGSSIDEATRMIVRNLERFPVRAGLAVAGLAAGLTLLVGVQFMFDSFDRLIDQAYYRIQRWSESVGFAEARSTASMAELGRLPGVYAVEPVRSAAARLKANGRQELTRVVGLTPGAAFDRPLDALGRPIPFKGRGVVVSEALAKRLDLAAGDTVRIEIVQGRGGTASVPVTALARDYSGFTAYIDRRALNRIMGEGDLASGAHMLVAPDLRPAFYAAIERTPQIVGSSSRDDTVAAFRQVMIEAFRTTMTFFVGFAGAIAFGVAYNTSRIALSERARDLATLRVLGFGQGECAHILLGELAILALAAVPLGILGGNGLAQLMAAAYSREEVRLPPVITAGSYGVAMGWYFLAVAVAGILVAGRIWRFDLVAVLKTRE